MSAVLILGAGSRVGKGVATKFAENGYKVALGSRSGSGGMPEGSISVKVDVTKPAEVAAAFAKAEQELGAPVNVVVYNVAAFTPNPVPNDPFSVPYDKYMDDMRAGAFGAYAAIQEAVSAFRRVSTDKAKVFIATSNILGVMPPRLEGFSLGNQKQTLAYFVQGGNKAYEKEDFRFYHASQVNSDGSFPGGEMSGEAHGIAYWNLVQRAARGGWEIRFIKDGSILEENGRL